jgi:hypothetical protein
VITASGPGVGGGGGEAAAGAGSGHSAVLARHAPRRREAAVEAAPTAVAPIAAAPITSVLEPVNAVPVVKEPSAQELASIHVGATTSELHAVLGTPESKVTIPDDDGHLLEICQYWAKGEPLGTVRLDNGRVVSVQLSN